MDNILIFGHRKPDTDSVTSAIALAYLKKQQGINATAYILSNINRETEYVLNRFGFSEPIFLNDTKLQIGDINYHKGCFINENETILNTYKYMIEKNITGVPLIDENHKFSGLITSTMISKEIIDGENKVLTTAYDNVLKTINGTPVCKTTNIIYGNIKLFKKSVKLDTNTVLITNEINDEELTKAINKKVNLIILTNNITVDRKIIKAAKDNLVNIIKTPLDICDVIKNINLSESIKKLVSNERFEKLEKDDYYDDFLNKSTKLGYNNYPVVDKDGICDGLLRITDINQVQRKKVILVDHNESSQSALGLEEADILEIIDHHQLGDVRTNKPINFRNMTVGSTNTIIYSMFLEANIKIPKNIASIMLAGILSDTLILTSPTTTEYDINATKGLAKIAKLNYKKFGTEMFKNSTLLGDKSKKDLINEDFKVYSLDNKKFAISQVFTLNPEEILEKKQSYIKILEEIKSQKEYDLVLFVLTDISNNGSYFLFTQKDKNKITEAFKLDDIKQGFYAEKIVSRKQQIVPVIMNALKKVGNH